MTELEYQMSLSPRKFPWTFLIDDRSLNYLEYVRSLNGKTDTPTFRKKEQSIKKINNISVMKNK